MNKLNLNKMHQKCRKQENKKEVKKFFASQGESNAVGDKAK